MESDGVASLSARPLLLLKKVTWIFSLSESLANFARSLRAEARRNNKGYCECLQ